MVQKRIVELFLTSSQCRKLAKNAKNSDTKCNFIALKFRTQNEILFNIFQNSTGEKFLISRISKNKFAEETALCTLYYYGDS
jgi:Holliday junction resolvase